MLFADHCRFQTVQRDNFQAVNENTMEDNNETRSKPYKSKRFEPFRSNHINSSKVNNGLLSFIWSRFTGQYRTQLSRHVKPQPWRGLSPIFIILCQQKLQWCQTSNNSKSLPPISKFDSHHRSSRN